MRIISIIIIIIIFIVFIYYWRKKNLNSSSGPDWSTNRLVLVRRPYVWHSRKVKTFKQNNICVSVDVNWVFRPQFFCRVTWSTDTHCPRSGSSDPLVAQFLSSWVLMWWDLPDGWTRGASLVTYRYRWWFGRSPKWPISEVPSMLRWGPVLSPTCCPVTITRIRLVERKLQEELSKRWRCFIVLIGWNV